ncbi:MAG: phosphoribosylanthranilate isomerase [Armatimonadetes bacterium]|nr:phosphoribosylanthranilate isomerase [Armatimonadota bacterium]
MVRVKICGITNYEDAMAAIEEGANALGFVFSESPRQVDEKTAKEIIMKLPPLVSVVGVFVNAAIEKVLAVKRECFLHWVQLAGNESSIYCQYFFPQVIKTIHVKDQDSLKSMNFYPASAFVLDSFDSEQAGGTGKTFDWNLAAKAGENGRVILAGGLTPDNVSEAVQIARPYAVDVSSGVESSPGKKDRQKMRAFILKSRGVNVGV